MDKKRFSPVLTILILMLLFNFFGRGDIDPVQWIVDKIMILPAIIIGLTFHEAAHGWVSYKLGDPTPKVQGRLTLNPSAHIDPFGFLALIFAGFGWGIPVQIDPTYYKKPRRDEFLVAIAGVTANFLIAILAMTFNVILLATGIAQQATADSLIGYIVQIFNYIVLINLVLMVFNLFPIPPLDGFTILTQIFNLRKYEWYYRVYSRGFIFLMILVLLGVTDNFLGFAVSKLYDIILNIAFLIV